MSPHRLELPALKKGSRVLRSGVGADNEKGHFLKKLQNITDRKISLQLRQSYHDGDDLFRSVTVIAVVVTIVMREVAE